MAKESAGFINTCVMASCHLSSEGAVLSPGSSKCPQDSDRTTLCPYRTLSGLRLLPASMLCTYLLCLGSETAIASDLSCHSNDQDGAAFSKHKHTAALYRKERVSVP